MDANRQTLTGPSHGCWGVGGWPRGRGGTCRSHCHLSSSTVHVRDRKERPLPLSNSLSADWLTSLCDGLGLWVYTDGNEKIQKKHKMRRWRGSFLGLRHWFVVGVGVEGDGGRFWKLWCTELYPSSSRPTAMASTPNSWLPLNFSTCLAARQAASFLPLS